MVPVGKMEIEEPLVCRYVSSGDLLQACDWAPGRGGEGGLGH